MEVICLEDKAFYALIDEVVERIQEQNPDHKLDKWISGGEAMHMLRISSKTTLANLRNEGKIRYSQPQKKIILYDRESIEEYLEKHAQDTF
ncbi:helix-turn-helix domain-containing protein [Tenacibaculum agarivorans]|uniref:helix-turn-helix domain-containing protein n=1 Tax=Tenacibaculum agarivorans TaxID=1908389 RepID=UPI00094B8F95|nr:helix-turn-helix domain-containing protein [Tenacibaculum agarivorans]